WRANDAKAANEPLREVDTIGTRGPMPLFLAQAHLLRARIQLSERCIAGAHTYRNYAAGLVQKYGYGRAVPDLAILDAEIACAENSRKSEVALAAAIAEIRGYSDNRTGVTMDGGWWSLLPRIETLLDADHPDLARLRAACAAYNVERNAYLGVE